VSLIRSLDVFKVLANVHGAAAAGACRSCCILWSCPLGGIEPAWPVRKAGP